MCLLSPIHSLKCFLRNHHVLSTMVGTWDKKLNKAGPPPQGIQYTGKVFNWQAHVLGGNELRLVGKPLKKWPWAESWRTTRHVGGILEGIKSMCKVTKGIKLADHALKNAQSLHCGASFTGHVSRKESSLFALVVAPRATGCTKGHKLVGKLTEALWARDLKNQICILDTSL